MFRPFDFDVRTDYIDYKKWSVDTKVTYDGADQAVRVAADALLHCGSMPAAIAYAALLRAVTSAAPASWP